MAPVHARWIAEVFADLDDRQRDQLAQLLGAVKHALGPAHADTMEGTSA
jgi:hypothetical protein